MTLRHVIVTGAAGGIGAATLRALVAQGCRVTGFDVTGFDRAHDRADCDGPGFDAFSVRQLDVRDPAAVDLAFAEAVDRHGPISGLVAAAGVLRPGAVLEIDDQDWQESFAVNTTGVFHTVRAAGRAMAATGGGSIVVVTSNAGHTPRQNLGAYGASKAAAAALVGSLGLELASDGVRCNLVAPGSTDTGMLRALYPDLAPADIENLSVTGDLAAHRLGIPLGRVAAPDDVAAVAVFLLSEQARHLTLQTITVDGGATLGR